MFLITNWTGIVFPSLGVGKPAYYTVPLINTLFLLSRGFTLTNGHLNVFLKKKNFLNINVTLTLILGVLFMLLQILEYFTLAFIIFSSAFGRIFFISTGFHGLHVLFGFTIILYFKISLQKNLYYFEILSWY